ncbi:hypothetical protein ACLKA6_008167 [Drosophila palustris]
MLQNSNAAAAAAATPSTAAAAAAAAANNAAIAASSIQPKLVVIRKGNQGFGFTLRHFIAYPPEDDASSWPQEATNIVGGGGGGGGAGGGGGSGSVVGLEPTSPTSLPPYQVKAMETIFIKEVQANGPAHYANLQTGDRVLMVNNTPIAGIAYSTIVSMIKQTRDVLTLHVVPKECDVLQMHYTSIAHTPESNRLTMSAQAPTPQSQLANGGASAAAIKSTFPQQQLISYPAVAVAAANSSSPASSSVSPATHAPPLHGGRRSGSITSNASGSGIHPGSNNSHNLHHHQQHPHSSRNSSLTGGGSSSIDFGDMANRLRQQHQQHQQHQEHHLNQELYHLNQQLLSSSFTRANQPPNLTVLGSTKATTPTTRQPKSAVALSQALYAVNASGADNSDLMIRLRESIKQKEEFLKSPLPSGVLSASGSVSSSNGNASQSSPHQQQLQPVQHFFPSHTPPGVTGAVTAHRIRNQVLLKQQQQLHHHPQQQQQQQQQQVVLGYDMYNSYTGSKLVSRPLGAVPSQQRQVAVSVANNNAKYAKELDYFETLQETGVTNKVFESKLVSHMSKGFDPFKPLSINTNAAAESTSASIGVAKKQSVLYESLQQHPLHQMQAKYQQSNASISSSAVDGQTSSRMELHKATLANATIESTPSKYSNTPEHSQSVCSSSHAVATLADIAESSAAAIVDPTGGTGTGNVVRRYKPLASSSFDEGKPMRRISYLRATNNEAEYHPDPAADGAPASAAAVVSVAAAAVAAAAAVVEPHKTKAVVEEHPDPTYDVIGGAGGGHEFIETPNGLEDVRLSTHHGSRRASMNSDLRSSIHIDADLNGKYVPNELEAFETEIEIKSSCINGKRMSEYRSWRQVKLEIKGDLLRIYSGRHAKSEHNVIELDIRNFKFYDESLDKKKFLIRMQSKPSSSAAHLATLGNELNLDDAHDKLTSSGSSSAAEPQTPAASAPSCGPYTEILFKTKSSNEMKRLFGLLQWKDSLNYDDNEQPAGKQLAEPQKTAATSSYLDDVAGAADSSPLSSHSGGGLVEGPTAASIAAAATSDSISPVMKLRKPSSHKNVPEKDLGSPKSKNWKDLLFRRGGGSGGGVAHADLASPSGCVNKTGGSIGLPLRACPMSKSNAYVPHLVEVCTNIVETKGLSVVGIYRIPGNKAAISELSELVNTKDFQFDSCATDDRWEDVNVVSSLLKLFIRSLPDALMPASFYINFIEADKKTGLERIVLLKDIVESLPRHPYETMKHLIRHLCRVSDNCEVNRMEPKNLAIIFGPSIIRTPNDTLETAVKDMKHQCRIVELLVTQYEYFFEGGILPDVADLSGGAAAPSPAQPQQTQEDQTSMLLHNLSKIERITERETRTSRFIPQLRRRTHGKRSAVNSDTYSGESVLSLDYAKVSASSTTSTSSSSTLHSSKTSTTTKLLSSAMGSSSSTSTTAASTTKAASANTKKRSTGGFLSSSRNAQTRKASLDEKDSGSVDSTGSMGKHEQQQRSSVDISILLTDDDSSSRLSDTGSMSLTTITDTLDSKLRNLRSGSESNDENGSPEFPKNRRHTLGQPLHLHSENIPYADESPERLFHNFCPLDAPHSLLLSRSCTATNSLGETKEDKQQQQQQLMMMKPTLAPLPASLLKAAHKLQHSATAPIHEGSSTAPASGAATPTAGTGTGSSSNASTPLAGTPSSQSVLQRNSYSSKNLRFSSSLAYERGSGIGIGGGGAGSEDDSEGSTTSDPKEKLLMAAPSPSLFLERYNKKRRDHRLFRSASFNCRNYSTRHMSSSSSAAAAAAAQAAAAACCSPTQSSSSSSWAHAAAALTKDEKTDMNLTKKRQIQNKQNRSIKRRHTVGGPHDYAANGAAGGAAASGAGHDLAAINYNHHNRHHQQQLLKLGGAAAETTTTTTTTTTVLRRLGAPPASATTASASASVSGVNDVANVTLPVSGPSSSNISSATTNNNNNSPLSDGSNGNSACSGGGATGGGGVGGGGAAGNNSNSSSSNSSSSSSGVPVGEYQSRSLLKKESPQKEKSQHH